MGRPYIDRDVRRRLVAEAALAALAHGGVGRFTTRAVAERAGLSEGTIFRHFHSKEEIVLEAMARLEASLDVSMVETADPLADLEGFFRHRAAFVGEQASVGRLVFSDEVAQLAGMAGVQRLRDWRGRSLGWLERRLAASAALGQIRVDLAPRAAAQVIQGMLLTFAMAAAVGDDRMDLGTRVDGAWLTLRTLLSA
ncbi:MAG: TetR/AcrR family transcriptional regulator [Alphaproteobacteria bacterium]|nr:TetR/AcrR family transcriptional regulator [Alphaproteobacteria bacterium]